MTTNEIALLRNIYEAYLTSTASADTPENKIAFAGRIAAAIGGSEADPENVIAQYRAVLKAISGQDQALPENEIAYLRAIVEELEPGATENIPANASSHLQRWDAIAPLINPTAFDLSFGAGFA